MKKVMLVDDEKMIVNSLALGFDWKGQGFEVMATASSGGEALTLIERLHPDVVFTDIKMPGMTGLELMTEAHKLFPNLLFVIISGHAEFAYAQQAMQLGAIAYCLKPIEDEDIEAALEKASRTLDAAETMHHGMMQRFLSEPIQARAEALVNSMLPALEKGRPIGVGLSAGDASPLLSGNISFVSCELGDDCRLYLFPAELSYLEGYAFRASALSAVTNRQLSGFVYSEAKDPAEFLTRHLLDMLDQLYAPFLGGAVCLGLAASFEPHETLVVDQLALVANKNRPNELMQRIALLTAQEREGLTIRDAVRIYNLCDTLVYRLKNLPYPQRIGYGYELWRQYGSFDEMLAALLKRLERESCSAVDMDKVHNETLAQVLDYLHHNFTRDVSFQSLCAEYCINPSYLSQLFKKEIGITFTAYMIQLRINYAKELLEGTSTLISEISEKVGYDNYLNFTKSFKRETGLTPKQYRNQALGGKQ